MTHILEKDYAQRVVQALRLLDVGGNSNVTITDGPIRIILGGKGKKVYIHGPRQTTEVHNSIGEMQRGYT